MYIDCSIANDQHIPPTSLMMASVKTFPGLDKSKANSSNFSRKEDFFPWLETK